MAAAVQISHLRTDVRPSVNDTSAHVGSVGELPSFVVNLHQDVRMVCQMLKQMTCTEQGQV